MTDYYRLTPFNKGRETDKEVFILDKTGRECASCFGTYGYINRNVIIESCNSYQGLIDTLKLVMALEEEKGEKYGNIWGVCETGIRNATVLNDRND